MKTTHMSAFPILIKTALADVQFKVMEGIWQQGIKHCVTDKSQLDSTLYPSKWGTTDEHRWDRNHPYLQACDEARELCSELGRFCLAHGLDPSGSPMVENLHFKEFFFEAFEKGRIVHCDELTPSVIHDAVEKQNVLHWAGWTVTAGSCDFATDDYGLDQYIAPLIAKHESGELEITLWMPGHEKDRARKAYKLLTGSAYTGEDVLGRDARHWMEPDGCGFDETAPDADTAFDGDYGLFEADTVFDDDYGLIEAPYELTDEDRLDLMVFKAKLEIADMCDALLDCLADDFPA